MKRSVFFGSLLSAFVVGGGAMWAWQQHQAPPVAAPQSALATLAANAVPAPATTQPLQPMHPVQPLTNPQAGVPDPMAAAMQDMRREMEAMHQRMQAVFGHDDFFAQGAMPGGFGTVFSAPQMGFDAGLQQGEDDHSVFYKLNTGDQDVSNVNVKVENGYVSINADLKEQSDNSYAQSSFSQTFPVPPGVNPDSAKVDKQKDAIVIRFDKVS